MDAPSAWQQARVETESGLHESGCATSVASSSSIALAFGARFFTLRLRPCHTLFQFSHCRRCRNFRLPACFHLLRRRTLRNFYTPGARFFRNRALGLRRCVPRFTRRASRISLPARRQEKRVFFEGAFRCQALVRNLNNRRSLQLIFRGHILSRRFFFATPFRRRFGNCHFAVAGCGRSEPPRALLLLPHGRSHSGVEFSHPPAPFAQGSCDSCARPAAGSLHLSMSSQDSPGSAVCSKLHDPFLSVSGPCQSHARRWSAIELVGVLKTPDGTSFSRREGSRKNSKCVRNVVSVILMIIPNLSCCQSCVDCVPSPCTRFCYAEPYRSWVVECILVT